MGRSSSDQEQPVTVWHGRRGGILACFFLLALANCGGGGGGGDSGGGGKGGAGFAPPSPPPNPSFYTKNGTPPKSNASGGTPRGPAGLEKLKNNHREGPPPLRFLSTP